MESATATQPQSSVAEDKLESLNPASGESLGTVETITPEQVQGIVDDVARVQPAWAELTLEDRGRYMRRAADVVLDELDEIAELLSSEQGKPRAESLTMELLPTIDLLHWCADNGPKILADEKIKNAQTFLIGKPAHFRYEPIGVVGVIAPWNYPWSIPFGEVAIALRPATGWFSSRPASPRCSASGSEASSRRRGCRRAWSAPCTAAGGSATRWPAPRPGRSSSPARSRSAARSARSAPAR